MQTYKVYLMGSPATFKAANIDNLRKNLIKKYPMEIADLGMEIRTKTGRRLGILSRQGKFVWWIQKTNNKTSFQRVSSKTGRLM